MTRHVRYDADQRARAKAENRRLVCLEITGKGGNGRVTFSGPADDAIAEKVERFITEVIREQIAASAARK